MILENGNWMEGTKEEYIYSFVMNLFFFFFFQQFSLVISEPFEKVTDDFHLKEMFSLFLIFKKIH